MKPSVDLGFVALADAAPLIVALEHGHFADEGLDVSLHREVSWATIRDKVAAGVLQGAHMLAPLAIAANLGVGSEQARLTVPMSLSAGGASLGLSSGLATEMMGDFTPPALRRAAGARRSEGRPAINFAVVFPYSMHNYMLRFWAASAGVDPDCDIRITVAPPTAIAARLKSGEIDGFCVGAPWGALCESESGAVLALEASRFWPSGPDKVLALFESWVERNPNQALALMRAVIRAAVWADDPANASELTVLLARRRCLDAPQSIVAHGLAQIRFASNAALHPWRSHAAWIVGQMLRWGQLASGVNLDAALACYRPELFRAAAADVGFNAPKADTKVEGAHKEAFELPGVDGPIAMTSDLILDGAPFDQAQIESYLAAFAVKRV